MWTSYGQPFRNWWLDGPRSRISVRSLSGPCWGKGPQPANQYFTLPVINHLFWNQLLDEPHWTNFGPTFSATLLFTQNHLASLNQISTFLRPAVLKVFLTMHAFRYLSIRPDVYSKGLPRPNRPPNISFLRPAIPKFLTTDAFRYLSLRHDVYSKVLPGSTHLPNMNLVCDPLQKLLYNQIHSYCTY
jgi:hypothetical protein